MPVHPGERTTIEYTDMQGQSRMTEEFIAMLRERVGSQYYDDPRVIDILARAILHSRGLYL